MTVKVSRPDRSSPEYIQALRNSLKWDTERDEPYLQLPSFPNLRLTPTRLDDANDVVTLFNHPSIGERLYRLPYPMSQAYGKEMVTKDLTEEQEILNHMKSLLTTSKTKFTETPLTPPGNDRILGFPFKQLRYIPSSPSPNDVSRIVGNIGLHPHNYHFSPNPPKVEEVVSWPLKDQMWDLGYVIEPDHGGRGIMGELVGCVLEGWVRSWMGIGRVGAYAEFSNPASGGVLSRNELLLVSRHITDWPVEKGGGTRETGRYEREI